MVSGQPLIGGASAVIASCFKPIEKDAHPKCKGRALLLFYFFSFVIFKAVCASYQSSETSYRKLISTV